MARPREFDQNEALDKALDLFWSKGFEKTSIQDLVEHTGVHRGSLYDTFGDKNQLFAACLERFHSLHKDRVFQILKESGEPREILERFFDELITGAMNNKDQRRGCFITNTAMELGSVDELISARIGSYLGDMETHFKDFLQRSQPSGDLNDNLDIDEMARFLLSTRQGLYVLGKTATDRRLLEDASKVAISAILKPHL
ncbi:hypothetical protein AWM70_16120 [Paenibacillus yonginensis]|uniref:HTH tetR-type domain-containing protein n=1 Tax=Paenibacillus yonginensis TaxID=1462996 RepID=A0A1B1N3B4_9BACL|nr:TetR/AcrR family transcriptional regulator [Paenibacillus yonginensis]ANS75923.1 hypothetical protein AWM70_16120 [Paenibacillus yonginensis]